jgi:cytochrome P450
MLPVLDMTDPGFWADIHAPLREALARHPLARSPRGALMALGHAEVATVLRDPRCRATHLLARGGLRSGPIHDWWSRVMFSQNPPAHTRLRSLVSRTFTPRRP